MAGSPIIGEAQVVIRPNTKGFAAGVQSGVASPLGKLSGPLGKITGLFDKLGLSGSKGLLGISTKAVGAATALDGLAGSGSEAAVGLGSTGGAAEAGAAGLEAEAVAAENTATQLSLLGPAGADAAVGLEAPGLAGDASATQLSLLDAASVETAVGLETVGVAGTEAAVGIEATEVAAGGALATLGLLAAAAGVLGAVALGKWALDGATSFNDLAGEVRAFNRIAGTSAEDGSKFVFLLKILGLNADAASRGIQILGKTIGAGTSKLGEFGVEVAKNKDGTTDLIGTILNVGDAYKATADQGTKLALVQAAFGRGGKELIPILTKTREEIKAIFDEAEATGSIFSKEDLQASIDFNRAQRDLDATTSKLGRDVGRELLPQLTKAVNVALGVAQAFNAIVDQAVQLKDEIPGVSFAFGRIATSAFGPLGTAVGLLSDVGSALGNTSKATDRQTIVQKFLDDETARYLDLVSKHKGKTDEAKTAQENMRAAAADLAGTEDKLNVALGRTSKKATEAKAALDSLTSTLFGMGDAERAAQQAVIEVGNAQAAAVEATNAYNTARAEGRKDNETDAQFQARLAQLFRDAAAANLEVGAARDHVAQTAVAALVSEEAYAKAIQDPKARDALVAQLRAAQLAYGDTTGAIQVQIDKLLAWNDFKPAPKELHVGTGAATAAVVGLQGFIDGVHGKTVDIVADVKIAGDKALFFTLLTLGKIRLAFNGTPTGATGLGIPGSPGTPFPMIAHGGELLLNASQTRAIGKGGILVGGNTNRTAATAPASVTFAPGAFQIVIQGNADEQVLREANDDLVAKLTGVLGQVG